MCRYFAQYVAFVGVFECLNSLFCSVMHEAVVYTADITIDGQNVRLLIINCIRPLLGNYQPICCHVTVVTANKFAANNCIIVSGVMIGLER